jgi:ADP-ribose pyrophosphatase YjhB (NUDIX family)
MFRYCPACASTQIQFEGNRFSCPDCGFVYYHNTAAATGCIISTGEAILLLVRGKEPARGKLDLPGGFVNPGEGALVGLRRECIEELGWDPLTHPNSPGKFTLFASFPNTYPYRNIPYNTCDLFFTIRVPGITEKDLVLEREEIDGIRFIEPGKLQYEDLAFDSTRKALRAYAEYII